MTLAEYIKERIPTVSERLEGVFHVFIDEDKREYRLSRSRVKSRYWYLNGTGQRCRFEANSIPEAIDKSKSKLIKHLSKPVNQPQG